MNTHLPLITCEDEANDVAGLTDALSMQDSASLFLAAASPDTDLLNTLVFRVAKKPKCLLTHVQRIYYCYQENLAEPLYAALVDFLIVLNKRGSAISWRMVNGTKAVLSPAQFTVLQGYLKHAKIGHLLPGNRHSIFSKGFIGVNDLVTSLESHQQLNYDSLALARDFIEYSQLTEAQDVLETAIQAHPGRLELHDELLALYQSTRNATGFNRMYSELTRLGLDLPESWQSMDSYFSELNQDG